MTRSIPIDLQAEDDQIPDLWLTPAPPAETAVVQLIPPARPIPAPQPVPTPAPERAGTGWGPLAVVASVLVTLAAVAATFALTAKGTAVATGTVAKLAVDPSQPVGLWGYKAVTNGFVNHSLAEAALWAGGILLFGVWVERNGGFVRAAMLVLLGSVGGVAGYWLFNTPEGAELVSREVSRVFVMLLENRGPGDAFRFLEGWATVEPHLRWSGAVCGGAGVCGALMAYAVLRRQLTDDGVTIRPVKFLFAAGFVAAAVCLWPKVAAGPFPYPLFVGGFALGVAVIVPEKVLRFVWERVRESLREKWEKAGRG